jgi:pimeloyl-ACP methyl ester carboxylesterase
MNRTQPTTPEQVNIPGKQESTANQPAPTTRLFPEIKVRDAYTIQTLARDGGAPPSKPLKADELRGQVVELEFENGQKLWVSGDRLLERLAEEKQREKEMRNRSGMAPGPETEVRLPTVWTTNGATRGLVGQLILKGLKIIGFDPASSLAKGLAREGLRHIENQLIEGTLNKELQQLNSGTAFDELSGDCSGWLFPFDDELKIKESEQLKQPKQLLSGEPYLLFIHGTASSSNGSFGKLAGTEEWKQLRADYQERILAFEHRSLSASPIKNVLDLIRLLPDGARLHLVSHSRGGLVGELLCLSQVVRANVRLADLLVVFDKGVDNSAQAQVARTEQREMLSRLWDELGKKQLRIERFVRVACPARGTTWLAENLDNFFSALLHAVELVPGLTQHPIYDFIKATLTSLVNLRADPAEIPGLEAMMPASPLIGFLNQPDLVTESDLAVITGDSEIGGSVKSSLLTILTKTVLLEKNDWVVNTRAMDGGLKRQQPAWQFFDQGTDVNHFSYFFNPDTRRRLAGRLSLKASANEQTKGFGPIARGAVEVLDGQAARGGAALGEERGTVFVLPGVMGSQLQVQGQDVWLHYAALLRGGMAQLAVAQAEPAVKPSGLIASDYKRLVEQLGRSYHVVPFAYDWRQSVEQAGEKLGNAVREALGRNDKPIYLLAHSMGGLVARSMMAANPSVWQELGKRQGRLVMLGTPNNGAHAIARMLLGKEKLLKMLALLDLNHNLKDLLNIVRDYPGILDLLPEDYFSEQPWLDLKATVPDKDKLKAARAWRQRLNKEALDPTRMIYVAGYAERTPTKLRRLEDGGLEVTETTQGDGRVPYERGKLTDVPTYYADVIHGDLADEPQIFPALLELLDQGRTERLPQTSRADRGGTALTIVTRAEEIEPIYPTEEDLIDALNGGRTQPATSAAFAYTLQLSVMHGHLRYAKYPVAVGHYVGDSIVSAEAVLNNLLAGRLAERHKMNLYPGPVGTAEVVFDGKDRLPPGALVIGLGEVGEVRADIVRHGITTAALRYALLQAERPARPGETGYHSAAFSSLLIGTYGGHALTVAESVEAIIEGAVQANRILQAQGLWDRVRIDKVELVEIYEDMAIQAIQTAHRLRQSPPADFSDHVGVEVMPSLLNPQRGGRYQRPFSPNSSDWWRRIQIVAVPKEPNDAAPDRQATQRQVIEKLVDAAARMPEQRANLAELINHLLAQDQAQPADDDKLEFTVLTDRARAESLQQATQRFWVDQLVQQSISNASYNSSLANTLFELLVPNGLKQQAEHVALVLDRTAAQYPWELLVERSQPSKPVVTQIGLLRQFKSLDFRPNPQPARGRNALVVGDTSNHGLPELFGAQAEASRVAAALKTAQYDVCDLIKPEGLNVIIELFTREYQILHIAAHGVFDLGNEQRQGIVLGKNQYLTTTELVNLRAVPDLVFINCCHLGKLDSQAAADRRRLNTEYPNHLAASIAEELIKIGVKAVVAAGWAVEDAAALTFATEFYREMLDGTRFGEAVLRARQKTFQQHDRTNTWGAYQCYGDPNFVLKQDSNRSSAYGGQSFYSRREYRDELKSIAEQPEANDPSRNSWLVERMKKLSATLPPELCDGEVLTDIGNAWHELGNFDDAIKAYDAAVSNADARASLKNIERLANLYCRRVDRSWYQAEATKAMWDAKVRSEAVEQLNWAEEQLQWLNKKFVSTNEWLALLGRICKSQALVADNQASSLELLKKAGEYYQQASDLSAAGNRPRDNYPTFNWLACRLLLGEDKPQRPVKGAKRKRASAKKAQAVPTFEQLLSECLAAAQAKLAVKEEFWVRVALSDAALLRHLHAGALPAQKAELIAEYQKAFATGAPPSEVDSALSQLDFLRSMLDRQANTPDKKAVVEVLHEIKVLLLHGVQPVG